jgi:hypothetical protein
MYSDLYFITTMEDVKFDMQLENRLYSFFLDILSEPKKGSASFEDEERISIWECWEKEL